MQSLKNTEQAEVFCPGTAYVKQLVAKPGTIVVIKFDLSSQEIIHLNAKFVFLFKLFVSSRWIRIEVPMCESFECMDTAC